MFHAKEYVKAESLEQAYELNQNVAENEQREPEYGD